MEKVLVISYFFPPCNLTAANRIATWQKYLPENQIYPIVITRNWTGNEKDDEERLLNSGVEERHVRLDSSEIYFLPYKMSLRDRFFVKGKKNNFYKFLSKLLTFSLLWLQNFYLNAIPYNNIYRKARAILKNDPSIRKLIVSANPFEQFFFGFLLKKEFPRLHWVADYRDDWTSNELVSRTTRLSKLLNIYNRYFEKKWISNSSLVISVSDHYVNKLKQLHKSKNSHLVMNGYQEQINTIQAKNKSDHIRIVYSGTLYEKQDFSTFFEAFYPYFMENNHIKVELLFIGSKESLSPSFAPKFLQKPVENINIQFTSRLDWEENIAYLKSADILLLTSYGSLKGIPTSKLYDYIACEQPILLCPSDNNIMQAIIENTKTGIACHRVSEAYDFIKLIVEKKYNLIPDKKAIEAFSSKNQVKRLAQIVKSL